MLFPLRKVWKVKTEFYNLFQGMFADTQSSRLLLNGIATTLWNTKAIFIAGKMSIFWGTVFWQRITPCWDARNVGYWVLFCLPWDRWMLQGQVSLGAHKLCAQGACYCVTRCPEWKILESCFHLGSGSQRLFAQFCKFLLACYCSQQKTRKNLQVAARHNVFDTK